jgi:HK97 family phage portal protein
LGAFLQDVITKYIWDPSQKASTKSYDLKGTEAAVRIFGYGDDFSNEVITEKRALGLATVYTCINVIAQTTASLPIGVFRDEANGDKTSLTDHPVYYPIAHQPNNYMSSANMFMTTMIHAMGWGNGYIGINRNGRGEVKYLSLICPWEMEGHTVVEGELFYKVRGEVYHSRDIIHLRWFSYDGIEGISPIRQNAMTMGKAFKSERYSTYALGKKPPGVLYYEGNLTPEMKAQNQKSWTEDIEAGKTPHLSGRYKYDQLMLSPSDAQYVETENLTDKKIYGIYRIPPVFAQDFERATFTNAEQSDLIFAKYTIMPLIRVIEQECNMKLFSEREKKNTSIKFNLNGLLRGDTKSRAEFYKAMRDIGVMDANEIRNLEDMNDYTDGDIKTIQSANIPVDQLRKFYTDKVAPTAGAGPTEGKKNGQHVNGFAHAN